MWSASPRQAAKDREGSDGATGRKGSVLAEQYAQGKLRLPPGAAAPKRFLTNEEVVKALQERVEVRTAIGRAL